MAVGVSGVACRVCGQPASRQIALYRPYVDLEKRVFDCDACGCRWVEHDPAIYEALHAAEQSSYRAHDEMTERARDLFERGDRIGLERHLSRLSKNRHVIETVKAAGAERLLELGCGKGALTSLFVAWGLDVLGVDISPTAIRAARAAFGDHFAESGAPEIAARAPYDCVYHVGTIGCVASPIELTRSLLELVRPGGLIVFNAPDVDACRERNALWATTPPPDLVTLFSERFWRERFSDRAIVRVTCAPMASGERLSALRRRVTGRLEPRYERRVADPVPPQRNGRSSLWHPTLRVAAALARLLPPLRSDYGLLVVMEKR